MNKYEHMSDIILTAFRTINPDANDLDLKVAIEESPTIDGFVVDLYDRDTHKVVYLLTLDKEFHLIDWNEV